MHRVCAGVLFFSRFGAVQGPYGLESSVVCVCVCTLRRRRQHNFIYNTQLVRALFSMMIHELIHSLSLGWYGWMVVWVRACRCQ